MSLVNVRRVLLIALGAISIFHPVLAQSPQSQTTDSSSSPFNGTWKNVDSDDTVTIQINGNTAVITTSQGGRGEGIFDGTSILYSGKVNSDAGLVKSLGTYELDDANTLIKHREIYYDEGIEEETVKYKRVTSASSRGAKSTSKATSATTPAPASTPAPTSTASPVATQSPESGFGGTWRPADDSAKLTISVSGRNAFLKYSPGARDSGTIRAGKIECQSVSRGGGIKSTDVFEMSANGRTLIRRRTLESAKGEVGRETLTYNRAN